MSWQGKLADPRVRRAVRTAERCGWTTKRTQNGLRLLSPDGVTTIGLHFSPSDYRARRNALADFRRAGVRV